jgi:hypothetical protein
MRTKRDEQKLERWFDGEAAEPDPAVLKRPSTQTHLDALQQLRDAVQSVTVPATIDDAQFPSFMAGIREQLETPVPRRVGGFWALASVTAAALIVALSVYLVVSGGGASTTPTVVEATSTSIEGAHVESYSSDEGGTATVWFTPPERDIQ